MKSPVCDYITTINLNLLIIRSPVHLISVRFWVVYVTLKAKEHGYYSRIYNALTTYSESIFQNRTKPDN
jgi:hypothetical protein